MFLALTVFSNLKVMGGIKSTYTQESLIKNTLIRDKLFVCILFVNWYIPMSKVGLLVINKTVSFEIEH